MTRAKFFCIKNCYRSFNSTMQLRLQSYEKSGLDANIRPFSCAPKINS